MGESLCAPSRGCAPLLVRPERELREILRVPKPEGGWSSRRRFGVCPGDRTARLTLYTEQEQVAFLRRAWFSDVRFERRKGSFVFALAAKARPSAASP
jgi:hypothetical protein